MGASFCNALGAGVCVLLFSLLGCGGEAVLEAEAASCEGEACLAAPGCDGEATDGFCDDCNPCTADANCTPCSALPPAQRDMRRCTADDDLPAFCAGKVGCVHVPLTTATEVRNVCFPVAGDPEIHPGVCLRGVCVENE